MLTLKNLSETISLLILVGTALLVLGCTPDSDFSGQSEVVIVGMEKSLRKEAGTQIDQSHTVLSNFYNGVSFAPLGQEFTPSFFVMNGLEMWVEHASCGPSGPGGELQVFIREGTIDGPIIGRSSVVFYPNCFRDIVRFHFSPIVTLVPGQTYVIHPVHVSGISFLVGVDDGPDASYSGGMLILDGQREPGKDLWFRSGLFKP